MLYRIFLALILLCCGYLIYDSAKTAMALSYAQTAEENFIIAPEDADDADVTVVVYIDYSCAACRNLHPLLVKAIEDDGNVRFIPRPIPSKGLDDPSVNAARLVYASAKQGKFKEAHEAMITDYRVIDQNFISNFALEHELDSVKLEQDMQNPEIDERLEKNLQNLASLRVRVLPTMLVDGKLLIHINGPLPSSQLIGNLFDTARTL